MFLKKMFDITCKKNDVSRSNTFYNASFVFNIATINALTFGTAFKEWKFFQYELDRLRFIDWMTCPVCDIAQHSVHVDGNMKLYRFESPGG